MNEEDDLPTPAEVQQEVPLIDKDEYFRTVALDLAVRQACASSSTTASVDVESVIARAERFEEYLKNGVIHHA